MSETNEENRRKKQERNLFSYTAFNRRRMAENGGYPPESICPICGRAKVKKGEPCDDCRQKD